MGEGGWLHTEEFMEWATTDAHLDANSGYEPTKNFVSIARGRGGEVDDKFGGLESP